jgi:hypothetical protein
LQSSTTTKRIEIGCDSLLAAQMSLTLVFRSTTAHTVGPLTSFRLDGEALRKGDGELIAKHERNVWRIYEV